MSSFFNSRVRKQVQAALVEMPRPVRVLLFTQDPEGVVECEYCQQTRELLEELAHVSDGKVRLEVRDFVRDAEMAKGYGITKIPALAVLPDDAEGKDPGIRFFGIPAGYEFVSLVEALRMVSRGEAGLQPETLEALSKLQEPVHLQVFVTPTCPYCPSAVVLAHKMALASDLVRADMVEATEFPHLSVRYGVQGVPRTVVNEVLHLEGAVPEADVLEAVVMAADRKAVADMHADHEPPPHRHQHA